MGDPFAVLGVHPDASLAELSAARRRRAFELHPDRGGDEGAMRVLNDAYLQAIALVEAGSRRQDAPPARPAPAPSDHAASPAPPSAGARGPAHRRRGGALQRDEPSFSIDCLPAEAFEALLVVAAVLGDVLVDDPPYLLETHLRDPSPCWCRLELLPEAGSTMVNLFVAEVEGEAPLVDDVRDRWIAELNLLGPVD